jgi:hypothetical protein
MNAGKFNRSPEDELLIKRMNKVFYAAVVVGAIAIIYLLWS